GIVLKRHALGDTSRIVVAYTREHGLIKLVAKGARQSPSRFGFALEPLSRSRFGFYFKPDRDLHLLSQAETIDPAGSRRVVRERGSRLDPALRRRAGRALAALVSAGAGGRRDGGARARRGDPARGRGVPGPSLPALPGAALARDAARASGSAAPGGAVSVKS